MSSPSDIVEEPTIPYQQEYTYADYLTWNFDYMVELIRGKIFKMTPAPGSSHQTIAGSLYLIFGNYLRDKPCHVFIAPWDVILPIANKKREHATTVVQPDLTVICNPKLVEERGCFGVPDLIIEIISPSTSKKDLQNKYDVYEEAGVSEYWIVLPKEQIIEIFRLDNRAYQRLGAFTFEDQISCLAIPELVVELSEVFGEKKLY